MTRWLLLVTFCLTGVCSFAQSDSMIVDTGTRVKAFSLANVDSITFSVQKLTNNSSNPQGTKPTQFSISQNYPNPFNPTTKIQFQIPASGKVSLNVYDMQGRLVKEIFSGVKDAGEYTFGWDGRAVTGLQVASGIYFFSVQFNNSLLSKKMIFLK